MTTLQTLNSLYEFEGNLKSSQQMNDELLEIITKPKEEDKFKGTFTIPKGTVKPFSHYIDKDGYVNIPDNELFTLQIKKDDIFKAIYMSQSGTHKTWQLKNDLFYFFHNDFKCLGVDAKGYDMILSKNPPTHNPTRIHPDMMKSSLPVYGLLPAFSLNRNYPDEKLSDEIVNKYDKIFSFSVSSITNINELENLLEMTVLGGMTLIQQAQKTNDIKELYKKLKSKAVEQSKRSLITRFEQAMLDEVFTNDFQDIDFLKLWKDNQIPIISFFNRSSGYIRYYVSKILKRLKVISESNNFNNLIQLEDTSTYLNKDFRRNNVAVDTLLTAMTDWRSYGFNFEISVQNPKLIDDKILEECNHFFIGNLMNPDILHSYMSKNTVDEIKSLDYDDRKISEKLVQYAYFKPGMRRPILYYPFQPICYHQLSI